jgi:cation transport ATPase
MTASSKPGFPPTKETYIAGFTLVAIALHVALKYALHCPVLTYNLPLFAALFVGGIPMVWQLLKKLVRRQFGSDLLAGVSIITATLLRDYLVAAIVVLMLSGAVLETSLGKIDELMHIGRRMRRIALQSALGGMAASMIGMVAAAFGFSPPIWGAVGQELIDLFAVLNAVRVALPTEELQDY